MVSLSSPYSQTKLYRVWKGMKERCGDPKHKSWDYYGGRGITVCSEWLDFKVFAAWAIENGYSEGVKLDRKENYGSYSPDNCRFTTHEENCSNRRDNVNIEAFGETKTLSRWSRDGRCKVSRKTILRRINAGVPAEEAITIPNGGVIPGFVIDWHRHGARVKCQESFLKSTAT